MEDIRKWLTSGAEKARIAPFVIFLLITSFQGVFGDSSYFWLYAVKTFLGAWMVWVTWDVVKEMRWAFSWEAVVVGVVVFGLWVGLEGLYPPFLDIFSWKIPEERETVWNPFEQFGDGSFLGWLFVVIRIGGSSFVVPMIEEVFYRSFVYRWLINEKFEEVSIGHWDKRSFLITNIAFGLVHFEWLPGIFCGLLYQWLVIRKKRIGDAMTAHAITNLLLGIYVVWRGHYYYW